MSDLRINNITDRTGNAGPINLQNREVEEEEVCLLVDMEILL